MKICMCYGGYRCISCRRTLEAAFRAIPLGPIMPSETADGLALKPSSGRFRGMEKQALDRIEGKKPLAWNLPPLGTHHPYAGMTVHYVSDERGTRMYQRDRAGNIWPLPIRKGEHGKDYWENRRYTAAPQFDKLQQGRNCS